MRLVWEDDLDRKLDELWALLISLELEALCVCCFCIIFVVEWELESVLFWSFGSLWSFWSFRSELFLEELFPLLDRILSFVEMRCCCFEGYNLFDLYIWFRNLLLGCQWPNYSKNLFFLNIMASVNFPDILGPLLNS